jgi:hypothetical protein
MAEPGRMMGKLRDSNGRSGLWGAPSCEELINSYLEHICGKRSLSDGSDRMSIW